MKLYITKPDQFQLEVPFLISCIATICAAASVMLAVWSLRVTEKALELTRITVRPYLAVQPGEISSQRIQNVETFVFRVKNTGPVPANLITAEVAVFNDAEVIEEDNQSTYYPAMHRQPKGVVVFPSDVYNLEKRIDLSLSGGKRLLGDIMNGKVKLRFRVTYMAQGKEYITVQTEKLEKAVAGAVRRVPIQPHKWT
jgi:archaellum component FlaG (FlaF/FlaG flagellin family)